MKDQEEYRPVEILLVEDNPADVRLTQEAMKEAKVLNRISVVTDGVEAMAFLRKEKPHANAPRPDLILLDLNLPRKGGREVLAEIKTDNNLKYIPVIILTTSEAEQDILMSYENHGNCFITKPVQLNEFLRVIRLIEDFWLTLVKLPTSKR
jgi:CheY-like chemotaxis protein